MYDLFDERSCYDTERWQIEETIEVTANVLSFLVEVVSLKSIASTWLEWCINHFDPTYR